LEVTDLTLFLLQHVDAIDKNIFIDSRLPKHQLHHRAMRVLLESEDVGFNKKAFVAQYIKDNILDLSHTGLEELPPICLDFPEVDTLVLDGTNIRQLPEKLLIQLKEIRCSHKRRLGFERQIAAMPAQDFFNATQLTLKKAELDFAGNNYAGTIQKLHSIEDRVQLPLFSVEIISKFWETYFNAALDSGRKELAKEILKKGFERIPDKFGPLRWKNWADRMLQFVLEDSIGEWKSVVTPYQQATHPFPQFLNLENHHFWVHAFRTTVAQKRFADARRLLQLAIVHAGDSFLHRFPWYLYLKDLHETGDTDEILATLSQYPKQIGQMHKFWSQSESRIGEINTILITAFLKKGNLAKAEILCTSMITHFHQIPAAQRDRMRSPFYHAQHNAVEAYGFLADIYAEDRPACAQYFHEMAAKYHRPRPRYLPLLEQVMADVNRDYSAEVWAEVERPKVFGKLKALIPQDWKKLEVRWTDLEVFGKRHLADLLRSLKHVHSKKLLAKMLTDADASVGAAAAMAMLELDFRWNPKKAIVAEIQRHHANNSGFEQEQIGKLLTKLKQYTSRHRNL
jgi:tetratricopeptide (TPR) repeat protein